MLFGWVCDGEWWEMRRSASPPRDPTPCSPPPQTTQHHPTLHVHVRPPEAGLALLNHHLRHAPGRPCFDVFGLNIQVSFICCGAESRHVDESPHSQTLDPPNMTAYYAPITTCGFSQRSASTCRCSDAPPMSDKTLRPVPSASWIGACDWLVDGMGGV